MGLPTEILRFFRVQNAPEQNGSVSPYSIGDFMRENNAGLLLVRKICQQLVNNDLLVPAGIKNGSPLIGDCFYNYSFSEEWAAYGIYDFVVDGFLSIRNHFSHSVLPVIVKTASGREDIGTCFYVGGDTLLTARHCVEKMISVRIPAGSSGFAQIEHIYVPGDDRIDLAVIKAQSGTFQGVPGFITEEGNILDEVLTMGYPPLPGFDAVQFAGLGTISANLKSSTGEVVAFSNSYLDRREYLLINARVKGGNSGGPVISKRGTVTGMLVHIPADAENSEKLDVLGYGVAIPAGTLLNFLQEINASGSGVSLMDFENLKKGFRTDL